MIKDVRVIAYKETFVKACTNKLCEITYPDTIEIRTIYTYLKLLDHFFVIFFMTTNMTMPYTYYTFKLWTF